jgi:hypothetical protein
LYKNNEIVEGIWNDYIVYDNKWLWCESKEEYAKRVKNYSNPHGGVPMPRGFPQTYSYMLSIVQNGGLKSSGIGISISMLEKLALKSSRFGPISLLGTFVVGQYSSYKDLIERMETHDEMVEYYRKRNY